MTTPLLETRGVWQRFGGLIANSDVSISVGRGEIVGLIGPNGAGKSTLFNLIAGVLPPTQGSIIFDGEDVTALPAAERCQRGIGRTFQVVKSFRDHDGHRQRHRRRAGPHHRDARCPPQGP